MINTFSLYIIGAFFYAAIEAVLLPQLNISDISHLEEGQDLTISCRVQSEYRFFRMVWFCPPRGQECNKTDHIRITEATRRDAIPNDGISQYEAQTMLSIVDARKEDNGTYRCSVITSNITVSTEKFIFVHAANSSYLNVSVYGKQQYKVNAMDSIQLTVNITAHPHPHIEWFDPNQNRITNYTSQRHRVFIKESDMLSKKIDTYIKIMNLNIKDAGNYSVKVENNDIVWKNFTVIIHDDPTVEIVSDGMKEYYEENKLYTISCRVLGYPQPDVKWFYRDCDRFRKCHNLTYKEIKKTNYINTKNNNIVMSTLNITAAKTGQLLCWANNTISASNKTINFTVADIIGGNESAIYDDNNSPVISSYNSSRYYVEGDNATIYCHASVSKFSGPILWRMEKENENTTTLNNSEAYQIYNTSTSFSIRSALKIKNMNMKHAGTFSCNFQNIETKEMVFRTIHIRVKKLRKPNITETNMDNDEMTITAPKGVTFVCVADGTPEPSVLWYKDEQLIVSNDRLKFSERNHTLNIISTHVSDCGTYECVARNRGGFYSRKVKLIIPDSPPLNKGTIAAIVILITALVIFIVFTVIKLKKDKKLRKELADLTDFKNGALESINPELPVSEQADLLPYEEKWEFPRSHLKLGKTLGAGAFGLVVKADAWGITNTESVTTVAVKLVKQSGDLAYLKCLASELKIMIHLGKHLNIVNLLGACTNNLIKGELLVIVEFCPFGNLHDYLIQHKDEFIDQINPATGKIDAPKRINMHHIVNPVQKRNRVKHSVSLDSHDRERIKSDDSGFMELSRVSTSSVFESTSSVSDTCRSSVSDTGEDNTVLCDDIFHREIKRNSEENNTEDNVSKICTKLLICWSYQVARGMEYLASRKVLHGDLAARNILLADKNVVKICDFGLAKNMYNAENYKKKNNVPLPVKWMAIESIGERVFSTQSDVWSYGIVLWEFFSLGLTPYPGMDVDEHFYYKLLDGYRMECPPYATQEIRDIMMNCWKRDPNERPSFTEISQSLGSMLEENVLRHYIDLNDPYMEINFQQLKNHSDYLNTMSAPTYDNAVGPRHDASNDPTENNQALNTMILEDGSGYLPMKSPVDKNLSKRVTFSPDTETILISDAYFDTLSQKKKKKKLDNIHLKTSVKDEVEPMLTENKNSCTQSEKHLKVRKYLNLAEYHPRKALVLLNPSYKGDILKPSVIETEL